MARKFEKLTAQIMRGLEPGKTLIEHGIEYKKLKNGDGLFRVLLKMPGYPRIHRTIGRESAGVTRKHCEDFIAQKQMEARDGRLNLPKGKPLKTLLFAQAAEDYLTQLRKIGGRGLKDKALRLRLHLIPFFGDIPLNQITTVLVDEYKATRLAGQSERGGDWRSKQHRSADKREGASLNPVSPATVNKELGVLSHLLNMAVEWEWLDRKPCKISKFRENGRRIEYLTQPEADGLLEAARQDSDPEIYLFVLMGLWTGMRKMEILSIQTENIDFNQKLIYLPKAKAGPRWQPYPESVQWEIKRYMRRRGIDSGWLFPSASSRSGHRMNIEKPFVRVVEAAGLDPKRVLRHTLRHTFVTHAVQNGIDLYTVATMSGHGDLQSLKTYAHQNNAHVQAAFKQMESRLPVPPPPRERVKLLKKNDSAEKTSVTASQGQS